MKIIFTGDTGLFCKRSPSIDKKLKDAFSKADFRVCNLEGPITQKRCLRAIPKKGPSIQLKSCTIDFLHELEITHLSMANNHIMDYGPQGLAETLSQTKDFISFGAGMSYNKAYEPIIFRKDGLSVGALAVAENGFGGAIFGQNGFATYDGFDLKMTIMKLRKNVDFLVVVFHAGAEEINFPLPEWKEIYHQLCDFGVDVVIGHHPHVPQGIEKCKTSIIVYSLGNFYFDYEKNPGKSYSVMLEFNKGMEVNYQILPHAYSDGKLELSDSINLEELNLYINTEESYINKVAIEITNNVYLQYYRNMFFSTGIYNLIHEFLYQKFPWCIKRRKMHPEEYLWLSHNLCIDTHRFLQKRALKALQGDNKYVD